MNPPQFLRAALYLALLLLCLPATAQSILSLEPVLRPGAEPDGRRAVDLTIRATALIGTPVTNGPTNLTLRAYGLTSGGMVVSEISSDGAEVEFTNTGVEEIDLSGWILRVGSNSDSSPFSELRRITGNAKIRAGGILVWSSRTNAPDQFPNLRRFRRLETYYLDLIELRDPTGQLVDEVRFSDSAQTAGQRWLGAAVPFRGTSPNSLHRRGTQNHFAATDWVVDTSTIGRLNPDLPLPWAGPATPLILDPSAATVTNGVWSGAVRLVSDGGRPIRFEASLADGLFFASRPLPLPPLPLLQLRVLSGSTYGMEAKAGNLAELEIRLPAPNSSGAPITPTLHFDVPGEFEVSSVGSIAPGEQRTVVQLRNLDDEVADGTAVVTLTASLPGFATASLKLLNEDNELATLQLSVPNQTFEGAGLLPLRGLVSLPARATHPTQVNLDYDGRVAGPEYVVVPAGAASAEFPVFIVNDAFENLAPLRDSVTATTAGWLPVTSMVNVQDDEQLSLSLSLPTRVIEGVPTNGTVTLRSPRDRASTLYISSSDPRLGVPSSIEIPAGTTSIRFPIPVPDDHASVGSTSVGICVTFSPDGKDPLCRTIQYAEKDPATVALRTTLGSRIWSGTPFPFSVVAYEENRSVSLPLDAPVQLRISPSTASAKVDPTFETIKLTDGSYVGALQINGSGQQLTLEMVFRGQTNTLALPSVQTGRILTNQFRFLAARPGGSTLLALKSSSQVSSRLSEMDPASGLVVRELPLPSFCNEFTVADSGSTAWAYGYSDRLVRIDLDHWTNSVSEPLLRTNSYYTVTGVAISRGSSDELAVTLSPPSGNPPFIFGMRGGKQLVLDNQPAYGARVIPGRTAGEFYYSSPKRVARFKLAETNAVTVQYRDYPGTGFEIPFPGPVLFGNSLISITGAELDAESLADQPALDLPPYLNRIPCLPIPERNQLLFANQTHWALFDAARRAMVAFIPDAEVFQFSNVVRWGSDGVACLNQTSGGQIVIFEHLLQELGSTDLGVRLEVPTNSLTIGDSVRFTAVVSNQGTNAATGAVLAFQSQSIQLGTLNPGETRRIPLIYQALTTGLQTVSASISAPYRDSQPLNDTARWPLMVLPEANSRFHTLDFPVRDLKAHPDGERLLAVVGPGFGSEGVAVIDPINANRLQTLPVGSDPRRVSTIPNGDFLLVQLGDNQVVRWNLSSATVEGAVTVPNGPILDVHALPETPRRWLAATASALTLWDDTNSLSTLALPSGITAVQLGSTGRTNWLATTTDAFRTTTTGDQLDPHQRFGFPNALEAPWFIINDDTLYFPGFRLDPVNRLFPATTWGSPLILGGGQASTIQSPFLLRVNPATGGVLDREAIPPLGYNSILRRVVRLGERGFALQTKDQLALVFQSNLDAAPKTNVSVFIVPPRLLHYGIPGEFQIGVTNRGASTVAKVQLALTSGEAGNLESDPPAQNLQGTWFIDLGPTAPGAASTARVQVTPRLGPIGPSFLTLSAALFSPDSGPPIPEYRAGASVSVVKTRSNLALELTIPPKPLAGVDFSVTCWLANHGDEPVVGPQLLFDGPSVPILRDADRGNFVSDGSTGRYLVLPNTVVINPGESLPIQVRCHADKPGSYPMMATAVSSTEESDFSDNSAASIVEVGPVEAARDLQGFSFPVMWSAWSPARHGWMLGTDAGFYFLRSDTLQLSGVLAYRHSSQYDRMTDDGKFVWTITGTGKIGRFSLENQAVDLILDSTIELGGFGTLASVPGHPETLVAIGYGPGSTLRVAAWIQGVPVPTIGDTSLPFGSPKVATSADGAIYVKVGGVLREFLLEADGLRAGRNLDQYASRVVNDPIVSNGLLLGGDGFALDLRTLELIRSFGASGQIVDGIAYGIVGNANGNYSLNAFNVETRTPVWSQSLSSPIAPHGFGGTNGVLFTGSKTMLVRPPTRANEPPTLTASLTQPVLEIGQKDSVTISVNQPGPFSSQPLRLVADLSSGIQSDSPPATGPTWSIELGTILGRTNLTAQFTATKAGAQVMVLDLVAGIGQAAHTVASTTIRWVTPELPVLLLQELHVFDNGQPLQFRLNRPAPSAVSIPLRATLIDGQSEDLVGPTAILNFAAGAQVAQVNWIRADTDIEPDEHFVVSIDSGPIRAVPESATITIGNDDLPTVGARGVTQNEGNVSAPPAEVAVVLDRASPVPVEVKFNTVPGTALPGEDYLPLSGRLIFPPGTTLRTLPIPIVGDTLYEPAESFSVEFSGALNGRAPLASPSITLINDDLPPAPSLQIIHGATGELLLSLDTFIGVRYTLESRTNAILGTWKAIGKPFGGIGGAYSVYLSSDPDATRFFRVTAD